MRYGVGTILDIDMTIEYNISIKKLMHRIKLKLLENYLCFLVNQIPYLQFIWTTLDLND